MKNERKNKVSMQVSIDVDTVEMNGGIERLMKEGIDKECRDYECSIEDCLLVSYSKVKNKELQNEVCKDECAKAGFWITIEEGSQWYNVEFECSKDELNVEPYEECEDEKYAGYYIEKIEAETITEVYLIKVKNEEAHVVKTVYKK